MRLKWHECMLVFFLKKIGRLSLTNIYRLACFASRVLRLFPLQLKRTIHTNISQCFPELDPDSRAFLEKQAFFQTIWRILEMPFFWFNAKTIESQPLHVTGETAFQHDFAAGQGALIITAHFGAWEAINAYMGPRYPSVTLYKPFKKEYQQELISISRKRYGITFCETSIPGVKKIFESLKQGKCVGIMSDHDPGDKGGVLSPFFGIPANTPTLTAKLIQKSSAPVYMLSAERLPKGQGFHLRFKKLTHLRDIPLEACVAQINRALEILIQDAPAQYEWSYKRFRRTPTKTSIPFYE